MKLAGSAFTDAANVSAVKRGFTPILLDGDDPATKALGAKYGLRGFPTVVFADTGGSELAKIVGADTAGFKAALAKLAP